MFDSAGVHLKTLTQVSSQPDFGTVADSLPSGTYTFIFISSERELTFENDHFGLSSSGARVLGNSTPWGDLFYKKITLAVNHTNITQDVRLNRIMSGLDVRLTDPIPSNVATIELLLFNDADYLEVLAGKGELPVKITTKSFAITPAQIGSTNNLFRMNVFFTENPVSIVIKAYDADNALISEKKVDNVYFYPNKRTTLAGALFPNPTGPGGAGVFTVKLNPSWGTPLPVINF